MKSSTMLAILLAAATLAMADAATNPPARPAKTMRVMAIGNSFSRDALTHLPFIVEAAGHRLVSANAIILGGSLEDHAKALEAFDADPSDRAGRPYGGKGLREMLRQEPWDVVTLQQASPKSFRPETFEPFAGQLVAAIRKDAPTAEIVVHQTWAYRDDHPLFTNGVFEVDDMVAGLRRAYDGLAKKYGLRQIPSGDAFQRARLSPEWGKFESDPGFDPAAAKPGELPTAERRSLHRNFYWIKQRGGEDKLIHDAIHASSSGHYLLGCVWFEFLFGESVLDSPYQSPYVAVEDTPILKRIAHAVVGEGRGVIAAREETGFRVQDSGGRGVSAAWQGSGGRVQFISTGDSSCHVRDECDDDQRRLAGGL